MSPPGHGRDTESPQTEEGAARSAGLSEEDVALALRILAGDATPAEVIEGRRIPKSVWLDIKGAASARKAKSDADKQELSVARARGELIPADEVRRLGGGALARAQAALLSLPATLGARCARLDARQIEEVAGDLVRDALERLGADLLQLEHAGAEAVA